MGELEPNDRARDLVAKQRQIRLPLTDKEQLTASRFMANESIPLKSHHEFCMKYVLRCLLTSTSAVPQHPATDEHRSSPNEKTDIPIHPLLTWYRLIDVVDTEYLMINDAFNKIEATKSHQYGTHQLLTRPLCVCRASSAPQYHKANRHENVGYRVEKTV
jgi:hypothetical protein